MRWSQLFIPTLRDDPAEAEAPSHRLLLRAGCIRPLMSGHYSLLPLGVRVRERIIGIVREEMNSFGAQEMLLPAMHPAELWERTNRKAAYDPPLFAVDDHRGGEFVLGPTHEEVITLLAGELQSYKELPQSWYQIQTKFRNEGRPKSGLLRVREFTMKDSYSFDLDQASLDRSFDLHYAAYERILGRLEIDFIPVQASSGAMGGSGSIEFSAPSPSGEDHIVSCANCDYAANVERATSTLAAVDDGAPPAADGPPERFDTPGVRTIADLIAFRGGAAADRQIKTLVYVIDDAITLVLLRGDHDLIEQKLVDQTAAVALRPAHEDEIKGALGASPGSLGAVGVTDLPVLADLALEGRRNMTTGANTDDVHVRSVDVARDITVGEWYDLRGVAAGEQCPQCQHPLAVQRAIEVGHVFKLGDKYTEALDVTVLGADGTAVRPIMGCYGFGIERNIAAIVEQHHDDKGIVWPASVAPFDVAVVSLNADDPAVSGAAESLYADLVAQRLDVIIDDRNARPGVKLADVELVGIPLRLTVGKRGVAKGVVELTTRKSGETVEVPLDEAVAAVIERVGATA